MSSYLKKYILAALLLFAAQLTWGQASLNFFRSRIRPYSAALTLTNPTSVNSKYGFGVEYRRGRWAYCVNRFWNVGVYKGKSSDFGFKLYMRNQWRHQKNLWAYENFVYMRVLSGESLYQPEKFESLGLPTSFETLVYDYLGLSSGYGRRYQKGIFFISVRAGLKGTYMGLAEEDKIYHRLFYVSGPGSVLEVNGTFGIQL
ncbi:MAG: hypothetical protein KF744_01945 [Taibaiella sp.]|nr:hypothetical protein [Taibaiella sp.]